MRIECHRPFACAQLDIFYVPCFYCPNPQFPVEDASGLPCDGSCMVCAWSSVKAAQNSVPSERCERRKGPRPNAAARDARSRIGEAFRLGASPGVIAAIALDILEKLTRRITSRTQACGGGSTLIPCPVTRDGQTIYPPELVNATDSGELECTRQVARACDPNNDQVSCSHGHG